MKFIKRSFKEFKSIFTSEDLLKENEEHANIVTASTMLNLFWICIITWVLVYLNIFKVGLKVMNMVAIRSILLLAIPAIICYLKKGKRKLTKHILFICFAFMLAFADAILKYNVTLIMVLPVILAARYYNKKFTISVAILTTFTFIISVFMSLNIGQQDLNSYNLIIPKGTNITINSTLRDAVVKVDVDENQRLKNILIHFLIPKLLVFNIVAFACVQVSQSGKNMISKQKEITTKSQRIETELNLAYVIQKNMLPSIFPPFPEHDEIDIYASMIPAKEVGGDFYDMFLIDDNHLAFCVADVTGKGIPASLVMMISKILIKNAAKIDGDISKSFERVNNMLSEDNKTDIFVTCWFGILDIKSGIIEFVNAGHNPPLIYSCKEGKFKYLKTKPDLVLAGLNNTNYTKNQIKLEPGDKMFLYTDGVVEATNNNYELYGEDRLLKFLNDNADLNVHDTIISLKKDVDTFASGAEQFDDITMLELLYKKKDDIVVKKTFDVGKENLTNVQEFVEKELKKYNCDDSTIDKINLVIEEIFVNISNYAYKNKNGSCSLTIKHGEEKEIIFTFEDSGIPFNPLDKQDPDVSLSASQREEGGLGIFLVKEIMDEVKYKYENNKNILTIIKKYK